MLFWLCIILFIIGIILTVKNSIIELIRNKNKENKILKYIYYMDGDTIGAVISLIFGTISIVMIIFLCSYRIDSDAKYSKYKERYNGIIYKIESTVAEMILVY